MQYRKDQNGNGLSVLGFGCMRFTRKGSALDIDKAEREIMAAFRAGVNYYDTAYVYAGSEALLGAVLARNGIRKDVNIATKLPHYMISSIGGVEKLFREELSRLQTDYVDYYRYPGLDPGEKGLRSHPEHRILLSRKHRKLPENPGGL